MSYNIHGHGKSNVNTRAFPRDKVHTSMRVTLLYVKGCYLRGSFGPTMHIGSESYIKSVLVFLSYIVITNISPYIKVANFQHLQTEYRDSMGENSMTY